MLHMTTPVEAQAQGWIGTDDTFGARLALIRQRMGWNIAEAARECGLGTENWRLWEQAGRTPSKLVTIAMAIATRSGCDYLWLVHGPQRGGAVRTTSFLPGARVIGTIGTKRPTRNRPIERSSVRSQSTTRPVQQTRPLVRESSRPRTPQPV
jgi:transcriptional regulator with XRE-family HTH domain